MPLSQCESYFAKRKGLTRDRLRVTLRTVLVLTAIFRSVLLWAHLLACPAVANDGGVRCASRTAAQILPPWRGGELDGAAFLLATARAESTSQPVGVHAGDARLGRTMWAGAVKAGWLDPLTSLKRSSAVLSPTHPEPIAPFVDLVLIGEAEEVLPGLLRVIGKMRRIRDRAPASTPGGRSMARNQTAGAGVGARRPLSDCA